MKGPDPHPRAATLAADISERSFLFLAGSGVLAVLGVLIPNGELEKVLLGAGAGLLCVALVGIAMLVRDRVAAVIGSSAARRAFA